MTRELKFKQTEIGVIPEDWEIICLGSEIEIIGGGTPKTSNPEYWNGDISWISVTDFGNGRWINQTEKHITEKGLNESSTKILHKGQIIISARGTVAEILFDLDSKIELNQQMNRTLEAIGQAIFKRWFVDFEFPN